MLRLQHTPFKFSYSYAIPISFYNLVNDMRLVGGTKGSRSDKDMFI